MSDATKTIREALDWVATVGDERFADQARAALDALETELAIADAGAKAGAVATLAKVSVELDLEEARAELATLRARLAPTDRPPVSFDDAWEGVMLEYTEQDFPTSNPYKRQVPGWKCRACAQQYGTAGLPPNPCKCGQKWAPTDSTPGDEELEEIENDACTDYSTSANRRNIRRALFLAGWLAHLRSQRPETEEQRAERLLGEWLVAHPGWTHEWYVVPKTGELGPPFTLALNHRPGQSPLRSRERRGVGATKAAAILDALAKARDAEGSR